MFNILRKLGHEIVAWDEEGLLREPDPEYYRWRLSPITMSQISHLIAWGPSDAATFKNYFGYNGTKIHIVGNPRFDLMRPGLRDFYKAKRDEILERFGDFVLVNTNFSKVNHFYPNLSELKKALSKEGNNEANQFDIGKGRHKLALFNHFLQMLPSLCKSLGTTKVVVRPHPAENPGPWRDLALKHDNLYVANEGNVIPWLMAARALIANGCTTQVEAAVLGTPSVNYQPVKSELFDFELPALVSRCTFSVDELCSTVNDILKGKLGPIDYAEQRKVLDKHIAGLDGPLAAERIIKILETEGYDKSQPPAPSWSSYINGRIKNYLRTISKRVNMYRPGHRNNLAYHAYRFPEISVSEIERKIACFGRLLNRFDHIKVRPMSKYIFKISV
jgi:surface carbohydrate biosynthesis protein